MSEATGHYKPFARGYGILLGVVILWAGSLGLFLLGKMVLGMIAGSGSGESGG